VIGEVPPGEQTGLRLPGLADGARWRLDLDGDARICTVTPAS
jgi:hypothetical protein